MKRILIVGNRAHQFITNYVKWFRASCSEGCQIDVFSYESSDVHYETDTLYDNIYDLKSPKVIQKFRIISAFYRHFKLVWNFRVLVHYDVVHIHYVEDYLARFSELFSKIVKNKLIISIWGSDYLKASEKKIRRMSKLFSRANVISIVSENVVEDFKSKYSYIPGLDDKILRLGFGLEPLESLRNLASKKKNNNITVTIGYNARKNQQHFNIIRAIETNKQLLSIRDKVSFVIPLTYPKDDEYVSSILELTESSVFSYTIIRDYMKDEDVARLRNFTDIFIQLQETDMLSGSMLEHIAAGNIVLTGSWLPYSRLEQLGLVFWKLDNIDQVSSALFHVIDNFDFYNRAIVKNRDIIFSNFQWEQVIKSWVQITLN